MHKIGLTDNLLHGAMHVLRIVGVAALEQGMKEPSFIRVDLGEEWQRAKMMELFRKVLREHDLLSEGYLYHAFDGAETLDRVQSIGCDALNPQIYSCGVVAGITDRHSSLYNPLETGVMLEKPGLLIYKRRSLVCIDEAHSSYRFKGRNYFRGLVAILLAKRPRTRRMPDLYP